MEDSFLNQGVSKYGMGKWTSILNDSSYKFHSSRKASTLAVRTKKLFKLNDLLLLVNPMHFKAK